MLPGVGADPGVSKCVATTVVGLGDMTSNQYQNYFKIYHDYDY